MSVSSDSFAVSVLSTSDTMLDGEEDTVLSLVFEPQAVKLRIIEAAIKKTLNLIFILIPPLFYIYDFI